MIFIFRESVLAYVHLSAKLYMCSSQVKSMPNYIIYTLLERAKNETNSSSIKINFARMIKICCNTTVYHFPNLCNKGCKMILFRFQKLQLYTDYFTRIFVVSLCDSTEISYKWRIGYIITKKSCIHYTIQLFSSKQISLIYFPSFQIVFL